MASKGKGQAKSRTKTAARKHEDSARRRAPRRLPPDVRPRSIDLELELDPRKKRFEGSARYALHLTKRRRRLVLHAAELSVSSAHALVDGESRPARLEIVPENETIVLHFERLLPRGDLELSLRFRGRVRSDLRGLYRSSDEDVRWLATQLCPTDARRVFPCFDEPGIKARYRTSVIAPADQTVLSNASIESEQLTRDGRKIVRFQETPPLSAYLVAVAVGPFIGSPPRRVGTTTLRVHTLPGREDLADFAAEAAAESLARLEAWFDMPHPYPKLDLVALPDFAFGAMENAGAVFFRDSILLLDPAEASAEDLKRTSEVVAHELSHMWFGNLVTMAWWNDLWLNESFATWMAYEIVDAWKPDWRIWLDFAQRRETALELDALASSHPIAPPIRTADEAQENFDAITYTKGAAVLRMLERYVGAEVFREGVQLYVRRHAEGAACAADLWSALGEVSGKPIEAIVAPWTAQTGYPLVSIRRRVRGGASRIELSQSRFLLRDRNRPARRPVRWTIPWVGRSLEDRPLPSPSRTVRHLLEKERDLLERSDVLEGALYGNADEGGFFRVQHEGAIWSDLLGSGPGLTALTALERVGLLGHQWALARAGRTGLESLMDLIAALGAETDPDVLLQVELVLAGLLRRLAPSRGADVEQRLRAWISNHFGAQLDELGVQARPGETRRTGLRRARILAILGGLARREDVVEACWNAAQRHLQTGEALAPDLADEIFPIAATRGDAALHAALLRAVPAAKTPQARRRALFALGSFEAPRLIRASLAVTLSPAVAPIPDRAGLLIALLSRPTPAPLAWAHLQRSWKRLERQMPPILLARIASATSLALPTSSAREIQDFFTRHPLAAGGRALRQIREELAVARAFERSAGRALEATLKP